MTATNASLERRPSWNALFIAAILVSFAALLVFAFVPLTYCPLCWGSGVKDGIVPVSSAEATKAYALAHPCGRCDGFDRKMSWLKRLLLSRDAPWL